MKLGHLLDECRNKRSCSHDRRLRSYWVSVEDHPTWVRVSPLDLTDIGFGFNVLFLKSVYNHTQKTRSILWAETGIEICRQNRGAIPTIVNYSPPRFIHNVPDEQLFHGNPQETSLMSICPHQSVDPQRPTT